MQRIALGRMGCQTICIAGGLLIAAGGCSQSARTAQVNISATPAGHIASETSVQSHVAERQFYYWPTAQVYRDCQSGRWYWQEGGYWISRQQLPDPSVIDDEIPYALHLSAASPVNEHSWIALAYGGDSTIDATPAAAAASLESPQ